MKKNKNKSNLMLKDEILKKYMTKVDFQHYLYVKRNSIDVNLDLADKLAEAILKWCKKLGVSQYSHYFFSLTGKTSGKVESFYETAKNGKLKINFSGKQLLKCEVDSSSFPNGEINSTYNAKGWVTLDLSMPIFVKENIEGVKILIIPSLFCNKDGVALDEKTCLLRAGKVLDQELTTFLHRMGMTDVDSVYCNVGCEQEYFLIDKDLFYKRKDLIYTGETILGENLLIDQHHKANYFCSDKTKIESFVDELNQKLLDVGIIIKSHHGEVAPKQQEIVQLYAPSAVAVNQNMYLMEIIDEIAEKHGYKVLLNEKPFEDVNGSGKHNNISISTNNNINLLDFREIDDDIFLTIISAFISGIDKHYDLLRLSTASLTNDHRLGGKEAPTSVFSVFLGKELLSMFDHYLNGESLSTLKFDIEKFERNRTSPFAFTGNKFEFRMVGSSQNISFPNAVFQTILADEFRIINAKLSKSIDIRKDLKEIIRCNIDNHIKIVYNGDCYSREWKNRAEKLGIIDYSNSVDCFECLNLKKNVELFERNRVLSRKELKVRYVISLKRYIDDVCVKAKTLIAMCKEDIIPKLIETMRESKILAENDNLKSIDSDFNEQIQIFEEFIENLKVLQKDVVRLDEFDDLKEKAEVARDVILKHIEEFKKLYKKMEDNFLFHLKDFPDLNQILLCE